MLQGSFDHGVAGRPGGDVQSFKDGHAAGYQRAKSPGKPGDGDLSHQHAQYRKFQDNGIEHKAALRGAIPDLQAENASAESHENEKTKNTADEITHGNDNFGGQGEIHTQTGKQRGENRHDFPQQQRNNTAGHGQDAYRINEGGLDGALQLDVLFDVSREPLQNGIQNTAGFAGLDHVYV